MATIFMKSLSADSIFHFLPRLGQIMQMGSLAETNLAISGTKEKKLNNISQEHSNTRLASAIFAMALHRLGRACPVHTCIASNQALQARTLVQMIT
jgi:hypothetical protein